MFTDGLNCLKNAEHEDRPGWPTTVSITEIKVDSVNELILADRIVIIDDISEHLGIPTSSAHKIVLDDLAFSMVSCQWVSS